MDVLSKYNQTWEGVHVISRLFFLLATKACDWQTARQQI